MLEILEFEFMRNALYAGLLAGVICGIIGSLVVVNRIVFISGGIAHAAYGGIGMAMYFGIPYMAGTLGFSVLVALIMSAMTLKDKHRSDTVIGVMWAIGMAIGVILTDMKSGYNVDLMSYLFGSILTVPFSDIVVAGILCLVVVAFIAYYYNDFLAMSYDEEFARVRRVPVTFLHTALFIMIAVCVVIVIRVVGLILVIALLTVPPFIAEKYVKNLANMMILSVILSCTFIITGLAVSYLFNLTSGATIILVGGIGFFISLGLDRILEKIQRQNQKAKS